MKNLIPLKAKVDLTPALNELVHTILGPIQDGQKGMRKLFSLCAGFLLASFERNQILAEAQNQKDKEDVLSGTKEYRNGQLSNVESAPDFCSRIIDYHAEEDARRFLAAFLEAVKDIRQRPDESISDKSVDPDFFNRWRKYVEVIDDAAMRIFWARLLVEETCCPNSISPRTLSVARNLSSEEAKTFERLCPYIVLDSFAVNDKLYPVNGTYSDALLLQDAGLISQASYAHEDEADNGAHFLPIMNGAYILKATINKIGCHGYPLTVAGKQIARIVGITPDLAIAKKIAKEMSAQNQDTTIYLLQNQDEVPVEETSAIWDTTQPD